MTEPIIPLSVVDALIKKLEKRLSTLDPKDEIAYVFTNSEIAGLEELKKEAIPVQEQPIEQRIQERIAFLEKAVVAGPAMFTTKDGLEWSKELHEARIDELRKLVPK